MSPNVDVPIVILYTAKETENDSRCFSIIVSISGGGDVILDFELKKYLASVSIPFANN